MPTVRTVTVKSSGGDYASLSSALAGEAANLVSLDRQTDIECHAFIDTTANISISGWTTDATRYLRIYAAEGQGHSGIFDTSKYLLRSALAVNGITISEDYVRIEGIQIHLTHPGTDPFGAGSCIQISGTSNAANSDIRIERCIIRDGATEDGTLTSGIFCGCGRTTVRNTLIYGTGGASSGHNGIRAEQFTNAPTVVCENCTIVDTTGCAVQQINGTVTLTNCYSGGHSTNAYSGTMTRTTCAHDTATVFSGSTASIAYSTANFVNVTSGSEDLHLIVGASATLLTGGTDLSGTFTIDIDGDTRSSPWTIGMDAPATTIYTETGSGGILCAGTSTNSVVFSGIGSGGTLTNSTSLHTIIGHETADGGPVIAGAAIISYFDTGSGGVLCSGISSSIFSEIGSGGILCAGASSNWGIFSETGSGGCLVNGTSRSPVEIFEIADGGPVIEGVADVDRSISGRLCILCGDTCDIRVERNVTQKFFVAGSRRCSRPKKGGAYLPVITVCNQGLYNC